MAVLFSPWLRKTCCKCCACSFNSKSVDEWVLPDGASKHRVAVDRLVQLRIFTETKKKGDVTYTLNPIYQTSLKKLLCSVAKRTNAFKFHSEAPSSEELETFALEQCEIRLWETNLNRVETTSAYLYNEFPSRDLFDGAVDYARGYNGLLWEAPDDFKKKMRLVVRSENHVHM